MKEFYVLWQQGARRFDYFGLDGARAVGEDEYGIMRFSLGGFLLRLGPLLVLWRWSGPPNYWSLVKHLKGGARLGRQ